MPWCSSPGRASPPRSRWWRTSRATRRAPPCAATATSSERMGFGREDLQAIWLTLKLAGATTVLLLVLAAPVAWWLAQTRSRWRGPVAAMVALPLVLPPTVLGFYLLVTLGPQ